MKKFIRDAGVSMPALLITIAILIILGWVILGTKTEDVSSLGLAEKTEMPSLAQKAYAYQTPSVRVGFTYPSDWSLGETEIDGSFNFKTSVYKKIDSSLPVCQVSIVNQDYIKADGVSTTGFTEYVKTAYKSNPLLVSVKTSDGLLGLTSSDYLEYAFPAPSGVWYVGIRMDYGTDRASVPQKYLDECAGYGKDIVASLKLEPSSDSSMLVQKLSSVTLPVFILGTGDGNDKGSERAVSLAKGEYVYSNPGCAPASCRFVLSMDNARRLDVDGDGKLEILVESFHENGGNKPVAALQVFLDTDTGLVRAGEIPLEYQAVRSFLIKDGRIEVNSIATDISGNYVGDLKTDAYALRGQNLVRLP